MIALLLLSFALFRDDFPVQYWLQPISATSHTYRIPAVNDPNMILTITKGKVLDILDMEDFNRYARCYIPDPNEIPAEPNLAEILSGVTDPNLIETIKEIMK